MRVAPLVLLLACAPPVVPEPGTHERREVTAAAFLDEPVALTGRVLGHDGAPIEGALIEIQGQLTVTDGSGRWSLGALDRRNALLRASTDAHHAELFAVQLVVPATLDEVELPPLQLRRRDGSVRFLFGGDTAFGRRWLDPSEAVPIDEIPAPVDGALIRADDPLAGTRDALARVAPWFVEADVSVVNLESPITDRPTTPHPDKDYVFFTLPDSLPALAELGIGYVSQGNNHVYDYLEAGIEDSLDHLAAQGIATSGAGATPEDAFAPHRFEAGSTPYSFLSASSVSGSQWSIGYVATDTQGGSADLRDEDRVRDTLAAEVDAGRVPIALLHTGAEYTETATDYARGRFDLVAESGAALVVGHHPHTAQGFAEHAGVLTVHSLGNLAFDQDRLETLLGMLAIADLDGSDVRGLQGVVVYLEDYRPRPATGELRETMLRELSAVSDPGLAIPIAGALHARRSVRSTVRTVRVPVVDGVLDLRGLRRPGESVRAVDHPVQLGRDLLRYGTFEDDDVDEDLLEASRWSRGSASQVCTSHAWRGVAGLCMVRDADNESDAVAAFRNRTRFRGDPEDAPNRDVTLVGHTWTDNAGEATITARYYASTGDAEFGEEAFDLSGGPDGTWVAWARDLEVPGGGSTQEDSARAVRLFLRHSPPDAGEGVVAVDDLALVSWEATARPGQAVPTPNGLDFVRVDATGPVTLTIELESFTPTEW